MNDDLMLKPALIGGVLLGILSAVPVVNLGNCLCCAWVIGGGMLAANLYIKSSPDPVRLGSGVSLGLMTGAIGGVVATLFGIPFQILLRGVVSRFDQEIQRAVSEQMNLPPEVKETLTAILAGGGNLNLFTIVIGGIMNLIIYSLIAMIGGVLGVALFEKRRIEPPAPYQRPRPPAPPPPAEPPSEPPSEPPAEPPSTPGT